MSAPVEATVPSTAAAASPPPRPTAFFLQAPARTLGPLTRDELLGYFSAGLVGADAMVIGPEWDGALAAAVAAERLGVALRGPAPAIVVRAPAGPRDPASLPPLPAAPVAYRRAGPGWRVVSLWIVALLAVQAAIVPAHALGTQPLLGDFLVAVAWRFALVAAPCVVVVAGLLRLARGLWPSARGPLLAMSAVYALLAAQFVLQPAAPAPVPALVATSPVVAAPVATVEQEDPTSAWAREQFEARISAEQAAASTPAAAPAAPTVEAPATAAPAPSRAVSVDPDPWHARARALHGERNWQALLAHATGWTKEQSRRYEAWQFLGIAQYELNQRGAAVASFERALAAGSRDPSTMHALAGAYLGTRRLREAADMSQRILDDDPGAVYALVIHGQAMAALGEYDEAVAALERAIKLRPRERYYYGLLAEIHFRFQHVDRGRAAVDAANALL